MKIRTAVLESPAYLSEADCKTLFANVLDVGRGGGTTEVAIWSAWQGNVRWATNTIISAGDIRTVRVAISRRINGAHGSATTAQCDADGLRDAVARAESALILEEEQGASLRYVHHFPSPQHPQLFYPATAALSPLDESAVARKIATAAEKRGMQAAGYVEVQMESRAVYNTNGLAFYHAATTAQLSTTIRNTTATGSGWAGVDWNDWARIDPEKLSKIAIDKCQSSSEPRAIEPGRYTAILEPQAVHDLFRILVDWLDRYPAEHDGGHPFNLRSDFSKLGLPLLDRRLTLRTDPMDPECGYIPFNMSGEAYQPTTWIDQGVLSALAYDRAYAIQYFGTAVSHPNPKAYRLEAPGATSTLSEMIASTKRGVLVTRLNRVTLVDSRSLLCTGTTRDGLWLIERGKVEYPIKNFRFNESPLFSFNNIEQIGASVRVFSPGAPAVVPPVKVRDFNFTSLADAV